MEKIIPKKGDWVKVIKSGCHDGISYNINDIFIIKYVWTDLYLEVIDINDCNRVISLYYNNDCHNDECIIINKNLIYEVW